jgi:hypothetical protein
MEEKKDNFHILELMVCPAFSVSGGVIEHVNRAAAQLSLRSGMAIESLLSGQAEDYAAYCGGCLYLSLEVAGTTLGASVTRSGNSDIACRKEIFSSKLSSVWVSVNTSSNENPSSPDSR